MDFLTYIETGNNKTLFIGMFVGVVAYIAKEQENQDEKPIRVILRIVLGAVMGYFLPERTLTLLTAFFNVKDIAVDALMVIAAAALAFGNLDIIKWTYKKIEKKTDDGKID
jgi:NAD/NADP transhydrogenase beta subunit